MPSEQNQNSYVTDKLSHLKLALQVIGGRWRTVIICHLLDGPKRYSDLEKNIGITKRMLSVSLRSLEEYGLVARKAYAEIPPRVEYSLTPDGEKIRPLICTLINLGQKFDGTYSQASRLTPSLDG